MVKMKINLKNIFVFILNYLDNGYSGHIINKPYGWFCMSEDARMPGCQDARMPGCQDARMPGCLCLRAPAGRDCREDTLKPWTPISVLNLKETGM